MSIDDALILTAKMMHGQGEISPQRIFYRAKGEIAFVQIYTSLRTLVNKKMATVRHGDGKNRFYELTLKGNRSLLLIEDGLISKLTDKHPQLPKDFYSKK